MRACRHAISASGRRKLARVAVVVWLCLAVCWRTRTHMLRSHASAIIESGIVRAHKNELTEARADCARTEATKINLRCVCAHATKQAAILGDERRWRRTHTHTHLIELICHIFAATQARFSQLRNTHTHACECGRAHSSVKLTAALLTHSFTCDELLLNLCRVLCVLPTRDDDRRATRWLLLPPPPPPL